MTPTPTLSTASKVAAWIRPHAGWGVLLFAPLAGLWWGRGMVLPSVACASFTVALVVVGFAGALTQRVVDDLAGPASSSDQAQSSPGIFQLLWLGQYSLLALALVLSLPAALLADVTGWKVPLRISLPLGLALLAYLSRRYLPPLGAAVAIPSRLSLPLAALVAFGMYRALSLHGVHAGALGHDTQQHIYWTQHILDYGFLPLTARDSDLLDPYPKTFHLLAACWAAAGLSDLPGIYVKIFTFLQAALACGFACELLVAARPARSDPNQRPSLLPLLLGLFVCWHLTLGDGQSVYRVRDLSGTPRYSAGWILFGLPLLVLAQRVGTIRDVRPWLLGGLPAFAALALGVNPVTTALFATFSVPFAGVLYFATNDRSLPSLGRTSLRALCWGSAVAVACLFANHFVVNALSNFAMPARVLHWLGVRTTSAGLPIDIWIPRPGEGAPLCQSDWLICGYELLTDTFVSAGTDYLDMLASGTPPGFMEGKHSFCYWAIFAAPVVVFAVDAARGYVQPAMEQRSARLFLALLLGGAVSAASLLLVRSAFMRLEKLGPMWALMSAYYRDFDLFLAPWLRCLLPASAWLVAPPMRLSRRWFGACLGGGAVAAVALLSSYQPTDLIKHRNARKEWRIDWPELRAIRHLNAFVPEHETVLIRARHWVRRKREHLLVADDPVGVVVPHMTTRLLFGISLGSGVDYSWADLDQRFCASAEARQRLLRQVNARWVLVRDREPRSRRAFENLRWECGVALRDLAAEYPAAWSEGDLALYRINP